MNLFIKMKTIYVQEDEEEDNNQVRSDPLNARKSVTFMAYAEQISNKPLEKPSEQLVNDFRWRTVHKRTNWRQVHGSGKQ